ncbi:hypothetical protein [Deinococcus sonorensis]|uniref:Lipoprotein n=2 Tax=Deinococcus sonorensis TaxID=309891 RepID=A0AAU7UFU1_9DEIO
MRTRRWMATLSLTLNAALAAPAALPHLSFDARLLGIPASVQTVQAQKREDTPVPPFFPPRHLEALFGTGAAPLGELDVYPVAGLLAQYPDPSDGMREQIDTLRSLVKTGRAPANLRDEMPFLPWQYAVQVLHAAVKPLNFPGVKGVRFLVGFISPGEVAPLGRRDVFYTFQGLSNDGKYDLEFWYNVSLPELPLDAYAGPNQRVMDALLAGKDAGPEWVTSLDRTGRLLNRLGNDARLTRLDAFLRTVRLK